jgi:phosphate transport system substrate-binding protein
MNTLLRNVLLLCIATILTGPPAAEAADRIRIGGSDTMLRLNRAWADAYTAQSDHPPVEVTGGGSLLGIEGLLNGQMDVAACSRPLTTIERSMLRARSDEDVIEIQVAWDGLAVYTFDANPIRDYSLEELRAVFTGSVTNWSQLGWRNRPIRVFTRDAQSGTHEFFREHVMRGERYVDASVSMPATEALVELVARTPDSIGYGGIGYSRDARVARVSDGDRVVGISPTAANVKSGRYPLSRPLYWYVNPRRWDADLRELVKEVLSRRGQQLVREEGFFALDSDDCIEQLKQLDLHETTE